MDHPAANPDPVLVRLQHKAWAAANYGNGMLTIPAGVAEALIRRIETLEDRVWSYERIAARVTEEIHDADADLYVSARTRVLEQVADILHDLYREYREHKGCPNESEGDARCKHMTT